VCKWGMSDLRSWELSFRRLWGLSRFRRFSWGALVIYAAGVNHNGYENHKQHDANIEKEHRIDLSYVHEDILSNLNENHQHIITAAIPIRTTMGMDFS